ncbi:MAG: cysteine hydrolase [Burkholderiaceae bacterium]|nr:cysteine hydrolase [Burkholderiaceae bacterium]
MALSPRFFSLLFAATCPVFAIAQDSRSAGQAAPAKSALLVVDAQVGVVSGIWESKRVVANIETIVSRARAAGVPVIWVQHADDDELKYGSESWKLAPNFVPAAAEVVIHKKYNSSFANTDLDQRLKALGVSRIVLAGASTNWCIRATAYAAVERGYDLALVSDAHSTESMKLPGGVSVAAEASVAELNAVFEWISVPNVRTEVKKAVDTAF